VSEVTVTLTTDQWDILRVALESRTDFLMSSALDFGLKSLETERLAHYRDHRDCLNTLNSQLDAR